MSMRSYEDQIWREDQWRLRAYLARGLTQLAYAARLCADKSWTQEEARTRAERNNRNFYRMNDPFGPRYRWYVRNLNGRWVAIRHLGNSGKAIIEGL